MGWILGSPCSLMADICNINSLTWNLSDLFFGYGVSVVAPIILIILQQNPYGKDSSIYHSRLFAYPSNHKEPQRKSEMRRMHPRNVA
jgi:hypothetical protein